MSEPTFKIVLINHSFQVNYFTRRWELFAMKHPNVDVTLLAPSEYEWYKDKAYTYDGAKKMVARERDAGNFHIVKFRIQYSQKSDWTSPDFKNLFLEIKPDIIYNIGTHQQRSLLQIIKITKKYLPDTKVLCFSMRGPCHNLRIPQTPCSPIVWLRRRWAYLRQKQNLRYVNKNIDAIFCHYPDAMENFKQEGYSGPIYMQTQVGVNEEWFHEDKDARKEIRDKYNIGDAFLFGSASRFTIDKGIDDILEALPKEGNWKYLMMGKGSEDDIERLSSLVRSKGLDGKVIMTGFIDWYDMAKYWNAVDCALHVPRTTEKWVETFSLAAIQPQITKKPVIGNTSGSVPYQIGFSEMIVPEGDIEALHDKICWVLGHKEEAKEIGERMYNRVHNGFAVEHINDMFYDTLLDILQDKYDTRKIDMAEYIPVRYE